MDPPIRETMRIYVLKLKWCLFWPSVSVLDSASHILGVDSQPRHARHHTPRDLSPRSRRPTRCVVIVKCDGLNELLHLRLRSCACALALVLALLHLRSCACVLRVCALRACACTFALALSLALGLHFSFQKKSAEHVRALELEFRLLHLRMRFCAYALRACACTCVYLPWHLLHLTCACTWVALFFPKRKAQNTYVRVK